MRNTPSHPRSNKGPQSQLFRNTGSQIGQPLSGLYFSLRNSRIETSKDLFPKVAISKIPEVNPNIKSGSASATQ
jgi:hypothetical protein